MIKKHKELIQSLPATSVDISLAEFTTFKIGGPADLFYEAKTTEELIAAVGLARKLGVPYFILGDGSNLLVADEGFRGMIIKIKKSDSFGIEKLKIIAEAGVLLNTIVNFSAESSLAGLEFAAGIPGTIGGAVRGNAGAWQQSIGDKVSQVKVLTPKGKIKWLKTVDCQFGYRQSRFKKSGEIILKVELELGKGDKEEIKRKIAENLEKRKTQPTEPSAGCIFANPKPQSAGELIECCGLKGKRIGDAQISPKHANFIVNLGSAKAKDVLQLIKLAKTAVQKKFGVELKKEIYLLGFDKIKNNG